MDTPTSITYIPVSKIVAGLNDRTIFNRAELELLAANIKENGLQQPPVYRQLADGTYQIVLGERRTIAMRDYLGWDTIPVIVREMTDDEAIAAMSAENRCRVQLNPIDDAHGYQAAMARGWDIKTCAEKMGVSTTTITNRLLLISACDEVQELVKRGIVSLGYGQAIGASSKPDKLGVPGLNRDYQLRAVDELVKATAPTLPWFGRVLDQLRAAQNEPPPFFDFASFTVEAAVATDGPQPPLPGKDDAPAIGDNPLDVLAGQVAYWLDASAGWDLRGDSNKSKRCKAAATSLQRALAVIEALQPQAAQLPALQLGPPTPSNLTLADKVSDLVGLDLVVTTSGDAVKVELGRRLDDSSAVDALRRRVEQAGYSVMALGAGDNMYLLVDAGRRPAMRTIAGKGRRPTVSVSMFAQAHQAGF